MNIFDASPQNIWNYKQNHPEFVIRDLKKFGISDEIQNIVRQSMLCRGINKWLKVRRDLIAYKKQIKHQIKNEMQMIKDLKQQVKDSYVSNKDIIEKNKTLNDFNVYNKLLTDYLIEKEKLKLFPQNPVLLQGTSPLPIHPALLNPAVKLKKILKMFINIQQKETLSQFCPTGQLF